MMYHLMVRGSDAPAHLPVILAEVFRITLEQADVSADSEWEDRNWDAVVTCEYERLQGDLNWSLTVYAANEVEYRPSDKELASLVAQRLSALVFTSWDVRFPWIRRVALPDGGFTLARVLQPDDDSPAYVVDATESRIPDLPNVQDLRMNDELEPFMFTCLHTDTAYDTAGLFHDH
ncbi:hypothetical protein [Streptomyces prasinopilosus]|uniref:Uncharacterized protein n=1 Tax=Streptomyces prasinopilosus TaxID=67344 RepID=A0A1G6IH71_9ACTN|nr:hypothetical protein [Streptomyces prasinopilosus]SDC05887.1 hypothetical protein SAMN05216505_101247 [Streptomyces prasinopilosus]